MTIRTTDVGALSRPADVSAMLSTAERGERVDAAVDSAVARRRAAGAMAGTACGFSTFTRFGAVFPNIAYAKLATLAEDAALAARQTA